MLICFNASPSIGVSVVKECFLFGVVMFRIVENMQKEEIASAVIIVKNKAFRIFFIIVEYLFY